MAFPPNADPVIWKCFPQEQTQNQELDPQGRAVSITKKHKVTSPVVLKAGKYGSAPLHLTSIQRAMTVHFSFM